MRLEQQDIKLPISNIDFDINIKPYVKHSKLLPNNVRAIIVGPSNCGKTNALVHLITAENGLKFFNLYIFSKTLEQPKYQYLKTIMRGSECKCFGFHTFAENSQVLPLSKAECDSVIVFDDIAGEKHDEIQRYFCMGRHKRIDCFYLGQTYTRIPKQLMRDNANLLLIFKQDYNNLKFIYNEHVNTDMNFKTFLKICKLCWMKKYGFLLINKECSMDKGRYRKGLDTFIIL